MNASGASGNLALVKFDYRTPAGIAAWSVGAISGETAGNRRSSSDDVVIEVICNAGPARKLARLLPMGVIKG